MPLVKTCTSLSARIGDSTNNSTETINQLTDIITSMNKALHPEDMRGGLVGLAESIEQAMTKLPDEEEQ